MHGSLTLARSMGDLELRAAARNDSDALRHDYTASRARAKAHADAQLLVLLASPLMQAAAAAAGGGSRESNATARNLTQEQRHALVRLRELCLAFLGHEASSAASTTSTSTQLSDEGTSSIVPADCAALLREAQALRVPLAGLVAFDRDEVNLSTRFVVALTPFARLRQLHEASPNGLRPPLTAHARRPGAMEAMLSSALEAQLAPFAPGRGASSPGVDAAHGSVTPARRLSLDMRLGAESPDDLSPDGTDHGGARSSGGLTLRRNSKSMGGAKCLIAAEREVCAETTSQPGTRSGSPSIRSANGALTTNDGAELGGEDVGGAGLGGRGGGGEGEGEGEEDGEEESEEESDEDDSSQADGLSPDGTDQKMWRSIHQWFSYAMGLGCWARAEA